MNLFPDIEPSKCGFTLIPASKAIESPYNLVEEVWEEPGDKWHVTLTFSFLTKAEGRLLRAHLLALRGQTGITFIEDTSHENQGSWSGAPIVDGAGQYGTTLNVRGFAANELVAKAGDRFQLGQRLHEITEDVYSSPSGLATLIFQPEVIKPASDGESLVSDRPRVRAMLKDARNIPSFSGTKSGFRNIQIQFQEALR
ncbi:hypothetical protein [Pseudidiomarina aestuarii]|uniref:hypothetical protein n=1 Tax=Pseudidiomarina aestuarii TaxID=624146 RepID=UPI003A978011